MKRDGHVRVNGAVSPPFLFKSFFMAGFECSTHKLCEGRRLDMLAATRHDKFASLDYSRLKDMGLRVAREGVRWHLVERMPGKYDFSSILPIVRAARATGTQVIWDLCHFGWPDHLDIFKSEFVSSLAKYAAAFIRWLANETNDIHYFVPINEISFLSWAAGDEGSMFPFVKGHGFGLKRQLVRATITTINSIREVIPHTRLAQVEPIIHVVADPKRPRDIPAAQAYRLSQFQAWDMLGGRMSQELRGGDEYLDLIGVNFYPYNEWFYNLDGTERVRKFRPITRRHPLYRPLREILREVYERYHRPLFIAETGAENRARASWLRYMCCEVQSAIASGIPVKGICLYPILNHPGWTDNRHCHNGLWDYPDAKGNRPIYLPLARELARWQKVFDKSADQMPAHPDTQTPRTAAASADSAFG
jgi:beta-glucosidase/6-phospho-beta-glucosidase/beta-galactosidase